MCNAKIGKRYYVTGNEKNYVGRMVIGVLDKKLIVCRRLVTLPPHPLSI